MNLPIARARELATSGMSGERPCCCGAPQAAHGGAKNTGGHAETGCRRYRRDLADELVERATALNGAPIMDDVAAYYARFQPRPTPNKGGWSVGPSDVGTCRKQIWYRERPPDDLVLDEVDMRPALVGTMVHESIARARSILYAWLEHEVVVRVPGLDRTGRLDEFDPVIGEIRDWKTCGEYAWKRIKKYGAEPDHWGQLLIYGYGKESEGAVVNTVRLVYINRATGEEETFVQDYSRNLARAVLGGLMAIIVALDTGQDLPQDRSGPSSDPICANHCPFVSHCWNVEAARKAGRSPESYTILGPSPEAEAVEWAAGLHYAYQQSRKEAEAAFRGHKPLLEGIEPGVYGGWVVREKVRKMPNYKQWAEDVKAALVEWSAAPPATRGDFADIVAGIPLTKREDSWPEVTPVSPGTVPEAPQKVEVPA